MHNMPYVKKQNVLLKLSFFQRTSYDFDIQQQRSKINYIRDCLDMPNWSRANRKKET